MQAKVPVWGSFSIRFVPHTSNFNVSMSTDKTFKEMHLETPLASPVLGIQLAELPNVAPQWGMWLGGTCKGFGGLCLLSMCVFLDENCTLGTLIFT